MPQSAKLASCTRSWSCGMERSRDRPGYCGALARNEAFLMKRGSRRAAHLSCSESLPQSCHPRSYQTDGPPPRESSRGPGRCDPGRLPNLERLFAGDRRRRPRPRAPRGSSRGATRACASGRGGRPPPRWPRCGRDRTRRRQEQIPRLFPSSLNAGESRTPVGRSVALWRALKLPHLSPRLDEPAESEAEHRKSEQRLGHHCPGSASGWRRS